MFDFGLDDRGEVVLKDTGEETEEIIAKECYPELETRSGVPGDTHHFKPLNPAGVRRKWGAGWQKRPDC
jgi:hypothetical protein